MPVYSDALTNDQDLIAILNAMNIGNRYPPLIPATPPCPRANNTCPAVWFAEVQGMDGKSLLHLFHTTTTTTTDTQQIQRLLPMPALTTTAFTMYHLVGDGDDRRMVSHLNYLLVPAS